MNTPQQSAPGAKWTHSAQLTWGKMDTPKTIDLGHMNIPRTTDLLQTGYIQHNWLNKNGQSHKNPHLGQNGHT